MHRKKHKEVKPVEPSVDEEVIEKPLTEYQIADRADKEDSIPMRISAIILLALSLIALIIACTYVRGILILK